MTLASTLESDKLKTLATTVRMLSADGVQKADSGHPGMPMGAADYASVLWSNYLHFNPKDPGWLNRDRFVLSAGHGSMLLYSLLHLFGYDLPIEELKNFRQWQSKTPGHPEFGVTAGVETTTGPLGQGISNAVGMALSGKLLASTYSPDLFNYKVYGICSDGDLMEGVASEAASLAGHLALNNLIFFYDDNHISIGGKTEVCFTENVPKRFEAYGWYVQSCSGHDMEAIATCLENALKEPTRPSLICARTIIGFGSPHKAGSADVHGSPLGVEELAETKKALGWPLEPSFLVPKETGEYCCQKVGEKIKKYEQWQVNFKAWQAANQKSAELLKAQVERRVPIGLKQALLDTFKEPKKDATRNLSGNAIQTIAKHVPYFIGGSADLEPSNKTLIKGSSDIQSPEYAGRNIRFGVREHAMGALANGLAYCQAWFPYTATFLIFSDYMRPTIRLAALSHLQTLFIFTHDSFWVGEDGPTHEPIEQIASLRLIPNNYVFRPADGLEVAMCYHTALELKKAPSTLLFTRQNLAPIERRSGFSPDEVARGGYIVSGDDNKDLVIVATGSEVSVAQGALKLLEKSGISARLVSMPCVELFMKQDQTYRESAIPAKARKISVEAGTIIGWERIVGDGALKIGIDHFGASAPGELLAQKFGLTAETVADKIKAWVG